MKVCRVCLRLNVPTCALGNSEATKFLTNILKRNGLRALDGSHSICLICKSLLLKTHNFIQRVLVAQSKLKDILQEGKKVTYNSINRIDRLALNLDINLIYKKVYEINIKGSDDNDTYEDNGSPAASKGNIISSDDSNSYEDNRITNACKICCEDNGSPAASEGNIISSDDSNSYEDNRITNACRIGCEDIDNKDNILITHREEIIHYEDINLQLSDPLHVDNKNSINTNIPKIMIPSPDKQLNPYIVLNPLNINVTNGNNCITNNLILETIQKKKKAAEMNEVLQGNVSMKEKRSENCKTIKKKNMVPKPDKPLNFDYNSDGFSGDNIVENNEELLIPYKEKNLSDYTEDVYPKSKKGYTSSSGNPDRLNKKRSYSRTSKKDNVILTKNKTSAVNKTEKQTALKTTDLETGTNKRRKVVSYIESSSDDDRDTKKYPIEEDEDFSPGEIEETNSDDSESEDDMYDDKGKRIKKPDTRVYPMDCAECNQEIQSKTDHFHHYLHFHRDKEYPYRSMEKFMCHICGVVKTHVNHYKDHLLTHESKKKFKCKVCHMSFKTQKSLRRHMVRHLEKKWVCDYCQKRFPEKSELKVHIRVHTGEKPFSCHICGASFAHRGNVGIHIRSAHQNAALKPKETKTSKQKETNTSKQKQTKTKRTTKKKKLRRTIKKSK